jgi:mono/diheme cytochrome c family protein
MRAFSFPAIFCTAVVCVLTGLIFSEPLSTVSADSSAKQRGAELFADRGCVHCHGPAGVGGGRGPDLQLVRKKMTKEEITLQIYSGGMSMPSFKDSLTGRQIQDLVAYLRAKRKFVNIPAAPRPKLTPANSDPN